MAFHPKFVEPLTLQQAGSPWTLSQEYVFALSDLSTWLGRYLIAYGVWLGRHRPGGPLVLGVPHARLRHGMAYGCVYYYLTLTGDPDMEAFTPTPDTFRISMRRVPLKREAQAWLAQLCEAIDRYVGQFFDLTIENGVQVCDGCAEQATTEGRELPLGVAICQKVKGRWLCNRCRDRLERS